MKRRLMRCTVLPLALVVLGSPASTQTDDAAGGGSTRKVLTCNVDGTYTCANEKCVPGYCCQIGG